MNQLDTTQITKDTIILNGIPVKVGDSASKLAGLGVQIPYHKDGVGQCLPLTFEEDGNPAFITMWFNGGKIKKIELYISESENANDITELFIKWKEERASLEWIGDDIFKTERNYLRANIARTVDDSPHYSMAIILEEGSTPKRELLPLKANPENTAEFICEEKLYKIQRMLPEEVAERPYLENWLSDGPISLREGCGHPKKGDRIEHIYFSISLVDSGDEKVIGVAQFAYMEILKAYLAGDLFFALDELTEHWGVLAQSIESNAIVLGENFTPHILSFETFHNGIPYNKELEVFIVNPSFKKWLYSAAADLTAFYVKQQWNNITVADVLTAEDKTFPNHVWYNAYCINYFRPPLTL